jgi:Ala-tRNA(Pro) deacylase
MALSRRLVEYLVREGVKYEVTPHRVTYTSQETAASVHVSGREVAKPVIVREGNDYVMVVLDAPHKVDLKKVASATKAPKAEMASEEEMRRLFPDCELGAMPPFGNLYGLKVLVDKGLEKDESITFDAGSHFEVLRMHYADFKKLTSPQVGDFASA